MKVGSYIRLKGKVGQRDSHTGAGLLDTAFCQRPETKEKFLLFPRRKRRVMHELLLRWCQDFSQCIFTERTDALCIDADGGIRECTRNEILAVTDIKMNVRKVRKERLSVSAFRDMYIQNGCRHGYAIKIRKPKGQ